MRLTPDKLNDYYEGRCSAEEEILLQHWFADHAETPEAEALLHTLFDRIQVENPAQAQQAFERFCLRTGCKPLQAGRSRYKTVLRWAQRVAAILILPLLVALSMLYTRTMNQSEWEEKIVPAGERARIELSDGTALWLNAGTRVTYPNRFSGKQRKIFIDGEVFAEVAHDSRHPFIISANDIEVRVLGTKFNMRAYNEDPAVEVALVDGSVRFDVNSSKCTDQVLMARNEVVRYDRLTGHLEKSLFKGENYHSRASGGGFYFFNETLGNIAAQLSRSFNRRIVIADPELEPVKFYAFFTNNEPLEKILKTFNADGTMSIRENNGIIYISKRN